MDFKLNSLQQSPELKEVLGKVERKRRHDYRSRQPRQLPVGSHHTRHVFFHPTPLDCSGQWLSSFDVFPRLRTLTANSSRQHVLHQTHYLHALSSILANGLTSGSHATTSFSIPSYAVVNEPCLFPSALSPYLSLPPKPTSSSLDCCFSVAPPASEQNLSSTLSWGSTLPQFGYNVCVNFLTKSFQGPLAFSQEGQTP